MEVLFPFKIEGKEDTYFGGNLPGAGCIASGNQSSYFTSFLNSLVPTMHYSSYSGGESEDSNGPGGNTDNTGLRAPDFYSFNFTVAIPNPITSTLVGLSVNISIDRHGQVFMSPFGGSVGKSAYMVSASLTANWMLQSTAPTAKETKNYLSGHGISVGGGYYGGVNWTISPANSSNINALGLGLYTPQVGASYNYTPDYLIINKK